MSDVAAATAVLASGPARSPWHDPAGFGFRDVLDIVNPLQHLPIVGSIYRWLTGDRPGEAAKIAGDALYGGPIGVALGVAGAAFEDKQGHDLGEQALAAVFGSDEHATKIAAAAPTPLVPSPSAPQPAAVTAAAPRPAPRPQPQSPQSPPQSKPARAADALPLVVPDHPPMPLYRGAAPRPAASEPAQDPVQALKMHNAVLERQIGTPPQSKPVPLIPPAGALPADRLVAPAVPAGAPTGPVDISQKMLDALDKYMKLEKERKGAAVAPGVDLAL